MEWKITVNGNILEQVIRAVYLDLVVKAVTKFMWRGVLLPVAELMVGTLAALMTRCKVGVAAWSVYSQECTQVSRTCRDNWNEIEWKNSKKIWSRTEW